MFSIMHDFRGNIHPCNTPGASFEWAIITRDHGTRGSSSEPAATMPCEKIHGVVKLREGRGSDERGNKDARLSFLFN